MIKIDCQKYADEIIEQIKHHPDKRKKLVILTAGDDPASEAYMRGKLRDCDRCGIPVKQVRVRTPDELTAYIMMYNWHEDVGGIIVQLPLPPGFNEAAAVDTVQINKDVDGFKHNSKFIPCTPEGILHILDREIGDLSGKTVLLIGRGKLVGRPLINLLLDRGCTLTVAHSRTEELSDLLWEPHDVVITATGHPKLVNLKLTRAQVVIDAGITRDENGKLCGDCCCFDLDDGGDMRVTTVPGGVGLMTRAMLMRHMYEVNI